MSKLMTVHSIPPAIMELLHSMGLPRHVISFKIEGDCEGATPFIEVTCKFMVEDKTNDLGLKLDDQDRFVQEIKQYHLVEIEKPQREIPQQGG